MKTEATRKEAANFLQVSVPTLRKFIKEHNEVLNGNKIDMKKLETYITEESAKTLSKKGRIS